MEPGRKGDDFRCIGNATWQGSATVNQTYQTSVYNLTTLSRFRSRFSTTNVMALLPNVSYYLFVDAYNSFTNTCINDCGSPPLVFLQMHICIIKQ